MRNRLCADERRTPARLGSEWPPWEEWIADIGASFGDRPAGRPGERDGKGGEVEAPGSDPFSGRGRWAGRAAERTRTSAAQGARRRNRTRRPARAPGTTDSPGRATTPPPRYEVRNGSVTTRLRPPGRGADSDRDCRE